MVPLEVLPCWIFDARQRPLDSEEFCIRIETSEISVGVSLPLLLGTSGVGSTRGSLFFSGVLLKGKFPQAKKSKTQSQHWSD